MIVKDLLAKYAVARIVSPGLLSHLKVDRESEISESKFIRGYEEFSGKKIIGIHTDGNKPMSDIPSPENHVASLMDVKTEIDDASKVVDIPISTTHRKETDKKGKV